MLKLLPTVNATLNGLAFVLLFSGWLAIRQKAVAVHKTLMLTAFACSSAFLACYDAQLGTVCYSNAGHVPGLVRDRTGISTLPATGLPFGLFSHATHDASMTVLEPGELLTAIRIPSTMAGAQFYFEKVRDRQVWDFPLVNVASAIRFSNDRIEKIRLVVNAVAAKPAKKRGSTPGLM